MIFEILLLVLGVGNLILSIVILVKLNKNSIGNNRNNSNVAGMKICPKCRNSYPNSEKKCPRCK